MRSSLLRGNLAIVVSLWLLSLGLLLGAWAIDLLTGALIAAPVFWMFTKFLAINLPGLTTTGWI